MRLSRARWNIEPYFQRGKTDLGLDHFEGRSWRGFHHHLVWAVLAYLFVTVVSLRAPKHFWCDVATDTEENSTNGKLALRHHEPGRVTGVWTVRTQRDRLWLGACEPVEENGSAAVPEYRLVRRSLARAVVIPLDRLAYYYWPQRASARSRRPPEKGIPLMSLPVINPHAAGLDVGSEKIHASIAGAEAHVFGACTEDLHALRDWLKANGGDDRGDGSHGHLLVERL